MSSFGGSMFMAFAYAFKMCFGKKTEKANLACGTNVNPPELYGFCLLGFWVVNNINWTFFFWEE